MAPTTPPTDDNREGEVNKIPTQLEGVKAPVVRKPLKSANYTSDPYALNEQRGRIAPSKRKAWHDDERDLYDPKKVTFDLDKNTVLIMEDGMSLENRASRISDKYAIEKDELAKLVLEMRMLDELVNLRYDMEHLKQMDGGVIPTPPGFDVEGKLRRRSERYEVIIGECFSTTPDLDVKAEYKQRYERYQKLTGAGEELTAEGVESLVGQERKALIHGKSHVEVEMERRGVSAEPLHGEPGKRRKSVHISASTGDGSRSM